MSTDEIMILWIEIYWLFGFVIYRMTEIVEIDI